MGVGLMSQLVIYALQVGGGTLALTSMPGRSGDYPGDLDLISAWKPGLVISTTTEVEMLQDGAQNFGSDIQSRASRWAHLPVDDFGAPARPFKNHGPRSARRRVTPCRVVGACWCIVAAGADAQEWLCCG